MPPLRGYTLGMIRRSLSFLSAPGTKLRGGRAAEGTARGLRSGAPGPCLLVSSPGTAGDGGGQRKKF